MCLSELQLTEVGHRSAEYVLWWIGRSVVVCVFAAHGMLHHHAAHGMLHMVCRNRQTKVLSLHVYKQRNENTVNLAVFGRLQPFLYSQM